MLEPLVVLALLVAAPQPGAPTREEDPSPRSSLAHHLELCRGGDYDGAARFLELAPGLEGRGPELARHLGAVLDRQLSLDLGAVSDRPEGDPSDGLARDLEEIARIPRPGGGADPVRLLRVSREGRPTWVFMAGTVARVDAGYGAIGTRWLLDRLPPPLLRPGPRDLPWWQWIAIPVLALLAWILAVGAARASLTLLARFASSPTRTLHLRRDAGAGRSRDGGDGARSPTSQPA